MKLINSNRQHNKVTLTLKGLHHGTLVGIYRADGIGSYDVLYTEFAAGCHNKTYDNAIVVKSNSRTVDPIPYDVPSKGILMVQDPETAMFIRFQYHAIDRTSNAFILNNIIGQDLVEGSSVFAAFEEKYVEMPRDIELSCTVQHVGEDIPVIVRARQVGYLPFCASVILNAHGAVVDCRIQVDPWLTDLTNPRKNLCYEDYNIRR